MRNDPEKLHTFFYDKKHDRSFSTRFPVIKDLDFDEFALFPFSDTIDDLFYEMQHSGEIKKDNPYYEKMSVIRSVTDKLYEHHLHELTKDLSQKKKKRMESYLESQIKSFCDTLSINSA